jgi:outer membrane protein
MNHIFKTIMMLVVLGKPFSGAMAQSTKLSLIGALDYASQNHPDIKNKVLGEAYSQAQIMETKSIGIPQISGNLQFVNNIQKQVFVFPNPQTGINSPIRVGNNYTTTATLAANWLAFDASYFIGLRAAEALADLSKLQTNLNKNDVAVNVTKAYYLVLITKENISLLDQNMKTLEAVLFQTEGYYKNGFAEKLDVDRLQLTLSNLSVQLEGLKDQAIITEQLLKLNMGMPVTENIELTDNLESLYQTIVDENNQNFDAKNRVEYKLLSSQLTLTQLDKKRYEVTKYPNLVFFANYAQNNFSDKIDYSTWYANSFWGFKVGVPIFSGFNNKAQLIKRNIQIEQTLNTIKSFENAATLEANMALTKFNRSLKAIETQKLNLALANEILKISTAKLKEGVGSNLEITNAQQEVKTSQTNYLNAIYDLLNAQIELKKAYGKL